MAIRTSTAFANLQLGCASTATNGSLSGVFNHGILLLYSGSQPASADSAATGSLLGAITLNGGAFTDGVVTNGLVLGEPSGWTAAVRTIGIPAGAVWSCLASGTGTIGWARFKANAADPQTADTSFVYPRIDFACGITSGEVQLSVVNVTGTVASGYVGTGTPIVIQSVAISV